MKYYRHNGTLRTGYFEHLQPDIVVLTIQIKKAINKNYHLVNIAS